MSGVPISYTLYEQAKNAKGTDCTFVFKDKSDGKSFQQLHAHRCVLSGVSPYFETQLKSVWKGNKPIVIETVEYSVFQTILKAIYLNVVDPQENLQYAVDLYEAAHLYQLDDIVYLVRDRIMLFCGDYNPLAISELFKLSLKYQDYALTQFLRKYFVKRASALVTFEDFNNYPVETINMLYQIDNLNADEENLFKALERYVEQNGETCVQLLKPAIETIRFEGIRDHLIHDTVLISKKRKNALIAEEGDEDLLQPNKKARFLK